MLSVPFLFALLTTPAIGQDTPVEVDPADWNGTWIAEGTLFSVRVTVEGQVVRVYEVQSLGQVWTARAGRVRGDQATIPVSYMGATADLLARNNGDGTAVVKASNCMPQFMVVCVLSSGQQAVFRRTASN